MTTLKTRKPSFTSRYTGTLALTRHALRRDRILASVWIAVMVLLVYASAAATPTIYTPKPNACKLHRPSPRVRPRSRCTARSSTSTARANSR